MENKPTCKTCKYAVGYWDALKFFALLYCDKQQRQVDTEHSCRFFVKVMGSDE